MERLREMMLFTREYNTLEISNGTKDVPRSYVNRRVSHGFGRTHPPTRTAWCGFRAAMCQVSGIAPLSVSRRLGVWSPRWLSVWRMDMTGRLADGDGCSAPLETRTGGGAAHFTAVTAAGLGTCSERHQPPGAQLGAGRALLQVTDRP